jgi:hypothetical protein
VRITSSRITLGGNDSRSLEAAHWMNAMPSAAAGQGR